MGPKLRKMSGPNYLDSVPDEILESIFVHIEPRDLLKTVQLVCKSWHSIISKPSLWRLLCLRHGLRDPASLTGDVDYRAYYFKLAGNLIRNGWAAEGLRHWEKQGRTWDTTQGDGFKREKCYPKAVGCQSLPDEALEEARRELDLDKKQPVYCWACTYYLCEKEQWIDLVQCGMTPEQLDSEDRPDICFSIWTAARRDCASVYRLFVDLLDEGKKVLEHAEKTSDKPQWLDGSWEKLSHVFSPIPLGTRYVNFKHNGQDRQFWAGHYGPKFTGATVKLVFKTKSR